MKLTVIPNATCTYCGCLCDDIELHANERRIVEARRACFLGRSWFFRHNAEADIPSALIDGRPAPLSHAIESAANLLSTSRYPLVYGLGTVTSEAQRAAVGLAEALGGVIDTHTSRTHGPNKIAAQLMGKVTCTLGEVKNRADLILYWGSNPVETHPRHLSRYSLMPKGRFVPGGRHGRRMIVVDVRPTPTAHAANEFLQIQPGSDFELLTAFRARLLNKTLNPKIGEACGVSVAQIGEMVERFRSARFGVVFFGTGLTASRGKHMNVAALLALVRELNRFTKFAAMPMRDHGNEAGSDNVLSWTTSYPFGVDFSRGYPRYNPGEFNAVDLLVRKEVDAALVIGADPASSWPAAAINQLASIPTVAIDTRVTATSRLAGIHITTSAAGVSAGGTAYRMDKVPLPLRAALPSPYPDDVEVLTRIQSRLKLWPNPQPA